MSDTKKYANMTKRRRIWFARIGIPCEVRHLFGGKSMLIASTGEANAAKAHSIAAPMLTQWRERIEAARKTATDPLQAEIRRLTVLHCRATGSGLEADAEELWAGVAQFFHDRAMPPLDLIQHGSAGVEVARTTTLFLAHVDRWKAATHLKGKTLDQALTHIKNFAALVPEPIEMLAGRHVQGWIEGIIAKGRSPLTVNSYLAAIRSYWEWMQSHDLAPEQSRPFWNRKIVGRKSEIEDAEDDRSRFEPAEVVKLWTRAEQNNDKWLAALIRLAAHTGARRESLATLKVESIVSSDIPFIHFADKTRSGIRDVPIHSAIAELIADLVKHADKNGYLIHETSVNKYGSRGDILGKHFTAMKKAMKFDSTRTFHSIRHTVAHLFEASECPEGIAQDILGHRKSSITYGTYSGITILKQKQDWIEKAIKYPV